MKQCVNCEKVVIQYGNANLGESLTPALQGEIVLCEKCWEEGLNRSYSLKDWEKLFSEAV